MRNPYTRVYKSGYDAFNEGYQYEDNPFREPSTLFRLWAKGWSKGYTDWVKGTYTEL